MGQTLTTIGFDADDTLWHNERFFHLTQARFAELLADHADPDHLAERLLAAERRNIGHYGFGIKGFVLSMIETAIEVTEENVPASVIAELMEAGREIPGEELECYPFDPKTGAASGMTRFQRCVAIIPKDPLQGNRTYEVTIEAEVNGQTWKKTWLFSTGAGQTRRRSRR